MAYDAPDYQTVLWDANGKPYWKTASGSKTYIPPIVAAQYQDDPKLRAWAASQGESIDYSKVASGGQAAVTNNARPGASLLKNAGTWNSKTGQFDRGVNWGNIMALGIAGAIAAPFVIGAVAGGAGAGAAGGTGAGVGLGETGATVGLASGAGLPGAVAAPTVAGIGTAAATTPTLVGTAAGPGATTTAAGLGTVPAGIGESAATTGLASGAGLPGAVAAPTVADLATVGSSVPGIANAAGLPATAATAATPGGILGPALKYGVPAASNIIGNVMQKGAIDDAVKAQTDSQAKALEAERQGGERAIGILSPWANVGSAAVNRLGELLHLSPPPAVPGQMPVTPSQQSSANSFVPTAVRNSPTASQVPQGPGPYSNWPIYQGPDGSKRRVDPQQEAAAVQAGAKRIG